MTRNQLSPNIVTQYEGGPIFTVDSPQGNVQPTTQQSVAPGGHFLIQPVDPNAIYQGYVCAWRNNGCRCSTLISNLDSGEAHMKIRDTQYDVKSTAPSGDYTLYTTTSETGGTGPTANATNGDIYIGG